MDIHNIVTPVNRVINFVGGGVKLCWSSTFGRNRSAMFSRKQKIVDSEVLRYCSALIPFQTGMLDKSGKLGTVIGSGLVQYIAPYAAEQYYNTATSRSYDANRGAKWFERMKVSYKADILSGAQKLV